MATERDFELLDDYLTNRLSEGEKVAFEQKLKADPDLLGELNFQKSLIKGIQQARISELKAVLNNTPVPPPSFGGAVVGKIVASAVVTGLVGTGLYYFFNQESSSTQTETTQSVITPEEKQEDAASENVIVPSTEENNSASQETTTEPSAAEQKSEGAETKPALDVYDPSAEDDAGEKDSQEGNTSIKEETGPNEANVSIPVDIDRENKKYTFHYQFTGDRLHLFGPFEKNLYEIMEFFSGDKRTVFLYYKDSYYLLKENNKQVEPLDPIEDPALLKKLREYRNK
jgi:hypothetical protein